MKSVTVSLIRSTHVMDMNSLKNNNKLLGLHYQAEKIIITSTFEAPCVLLYHLPKCHHSLEICCSYPSCILLYASPTISFLLSEFQVFFASMKTLLRAFFYVSSDVHTAQESLQAKYLEVVDLLECRT